MKSVYKPLATSMHIPARNHLTRIDRDDPLPYYFLPLTAWLYRGRLQAALGLMESQRSGFGLEIGYGSGILLPELARRCERLAALDYHRRGQVVQTMLAREGVAAPLLTGDVTALPVASASCNTVACLSLMEHLTAPALDAAAREVARILAPGGVAVVGFPVRSFLSDAFFRLVGHSPRDIHPSSHHDIASALGRHLKIEAWSWYPFALPRALAGYWVCRAARLT